MAQIHHLHSDTPVLKRMFQTSEKDTIKSNHVDTYQETSLCLMENTFIHIREYSYVLRDEVLQKFKQPLPSPTLRERFKKSVVMGIDPVFLEARSEEGLKSFLRVHGLMVELARVQLIVETAQRVVTHAGHASLIYLHHAVETMAKSYQFLCTSIENEMMTMKGQIQKLTLMSATKAWREENRKKVKGYRRKMVEHLSEANESLTKVVRLARPDPHQRLSRESVGLPQLFVAQTGIMHSQHGAQSMAVSENSQHALKEFGEGLFFRCLLKKVKELLPSLASMTITDQASIKQMYDALSATTQSHFFILMLKSELAQALNYKNTDGSVLLAHIKFIKQEGALSDFLLGAWLAKSHQKTVVYENRLLTYAVQGDRLAGIFYGALAMLQAPMDLSKLAMGFFQDEKGEQHNFLQLQSAVGEEGDHLFMHVFRRICEMVKRYLVDHVIHPSGGTQLVELSKKLQHKKREPVVPGTARLVINTSENEQYSSGFFGTTRSPVWKSLQEKALETAKESVVEAIKSHVIPSPFNNLI